MLAQYFGAKSKLVPTLLPIFKQAPHRIYGVIYGGSAQSLWLKEPVQIEYYNDINGRMVNFMTQVRENPEALANALEYTPYSKQEFITAMDISPDPLEDARRVFILLNQGSNGRLSDPYWHTPSHENSRQGNRVNFFDNKIKDIQKAAKRLKRAYITQRPALDLMKFLNHSGVLLYLDPPYLPKTRTAVRYPHDMTEDGHIEMLEFCVDAKPHIVLSGYDSDLYNSYLANWYKVELEVNTRGSKNGEGATKKKEVIWTNYYINDSIETQLTLI